MFLYNSPRVFTFSDNYRIIYYHVVSNVRKSYQFGHLSVSDFDSQIDFFKKRYKIISLKEAVNRSKNGLSLSNHLSITTDDGFIENFTNIAPILLKKKVTATFFLIENCIDNLDLMWRNKLLYIVNKCDKNLELLAESVESEFGIKPIKKSESLLDWSERTWPMDMKDIISNFLWEISDLENLDNFLEKQTPYMSTNQIRVLLNNGFDIGIHTKSHPFCNKLEFDVLNEEIIASSRRLGKKFNRKVNFASYPFGARPSFNLEKKLITKSQIQVLLGINSKITNEREPFKWERDKQDSSYNSVNWLRFNCLPYLKSLL